MKKKTDVWPIANLHKQTINFQAYQREPTVWDRSAKQRLVDSIVRGFDIGAIYLYDNADGTFDCIDGRQRISAIKSFFDDHADVGFSYQAMNEIYDDDVNTFASLEGKGFAEIKGLAEDNDAKAFVEIVNNYKLTVVILSASARAEEFNLQFTRLNLGVVINSGEKLNAMIGAMRDVCFDQLAKNHFLQSVNIPTRRYAQGQLAAQIVAQVFSLEEESVEFTRVRYVDLQRFFKNKTDLDKKEREWITRLESIMNRLATQQLPPLRSRSIVLSLVLLAYKLPLSDPDAKHFTDFTKAFVDGLKKHVERMARGESREFEYLFEFQKHLSQGSGERPAVKRRHEILKQCYQHWIKKNALPNDSDMGPAADWNGKPS